MNRCRPIVRSLLLAWLVLGRSGSGAPTTAYQAQQAVRGWLRWDAQPMRTAMAGQVGKVASFTDAHGEAIYHVVSLSPSGFVVVSPDDTLEPIVAFAETGYFQATEENPLFSLLQRDLAGRARCARERQQGLLQSPSASAVVDREAAMRGRWDRVLQMDDAGGIRLAQLSSISDVRVAPLVQSKWGQSTEGSNACYNYYTPNQYSAGCVATMMAQLIRYHEWPATGVGTPSYQIWVDGSSQWEALRGGDGSGGAYDWSLMPLDPNSSTPVAQRQMIGSLTHDTGVSVNMSYWSSGSAASAWDGADQLVSRFGYGNAVIGYNGGATMGEGLFGMVNPNLNAGLPVMLTVLRDGGGHAILCDGYGYQDATAYHHLNMGWRGTYDAWYNLPDVDADATYHYTNVDSCVYNIYTNGGGEIISGRVLSGGAPVQGITVVADDGDASLSDVTDANGIYAITHATTNTTYTVGVTASGYAPTNQVVEVGLSVNYAATSGNRDNIDFELTPQQTSPQNSRATLLIIRG